MNLKTSHKVLIFFISAVCFIGCDRVTKDLAKEHLMNKPTISYFHDTFRLLYVENTGAALGLGSELPQPYNFWLLSILPLAFMIFLAIYITRKTGEMSLNKMLSFSLIISGGIGNVIDRIAYDRHVTDFMNLGIENLRTGIFNVADMCVTTGVIGLLLLMYKDNKTDTAGTPV